MQIDISSRIISMLRGFRASTIYREGLEIVPLYLAAERPVVRRGDLLLMVDDARFPLEPGENPARMSVRFRTLGCYPLTGAVESRATSVKDIIGELFLTSHSERMGRATDLHQVGSMERMKRDGYF